MDCDNGAVTDDGSRTGLLLSRSAAAAAQESAARLSPSPSTKTRSLSDGGCSTPSCRRLSPPPLLLDSNTRRTCKDDSSIGSSTVGVAPVTPRRPSSLQHRGSNRQLQQLQSQQNKVRHPSTPAYASSARLQQEQQEQQQLFLNQPTYMAKPTPLSPKLDPSQIYASPTNILPRRSRGLDFSRAATSLHHSTLAEQSSPDSSPSVSGGHAAMNIPGRIPGRKPGDYGGATESSTSLWSMMGRSQEKAQPSGSLGSANYACSDSSSSSDDNDLMDEDLDEPFVTTPQVGRVGTPTMTPPASSAQPNGIPWMPGSPAVNSLLSFQNRQRPRKQPKRKVRGPLGLGFSSISTPPTAATAAGIGMGMGMGISTLSKSPPGYMLGRDGGNAAQHAHAHARRESISWAANQLHISGSESDDGLKAHMEAGEGLLSTPGRDGQRGVVRRVVTRRGNLLPKTKGFARIRAALAEESTPVESDFRREAEVVRQVLESDMEPEQLRLPPPPPLRSAATTPNSSPSIPENMDDLTDDVMAMDAASAGLGLSVGPKLLEPHAASARTTPPRQSPYLPLDDVSMDSPLGAGSGSQGSSSMVFPSGAIFPITAGSSRGDTPQPGQPGQPGPPGPSGPSRGPMQQPVLPSAAEITRRINSKRRRDDDLDPVSFKRRAVSPGMSVHNSPITQSPLQRDTAPWGGSSSRPGSNSGSSDAKFFPPLPVSGGSAGSVLTDGTSGGSRAGGSKGRVGYQTMADANDSITRLSIE